MKQAGNRVMNQTIRIAISTLIAGCALASLIARAQTSSSTPPVSSQTIQETEKNQAKKKSKVILQRSTDENGNVTETRDPSQPLPAPPQPIPAEPKTAAPAVQVPTQSNIEDNERAAP